MNQGVTYPYPTWVTHTTSHHPLPNRPIRLVHEVKSAFKTLSGELSFSLLWGTGWEWDLGMVSDSAIHLSLRVCFSQNITFRIKNIDLDFFDKHDMTRHIADLIFESWILCNYDHAWLIHNLPLYNRYVIIIIWKMYVMTLLYFRLYFSIWYKINIMVELNGFRIYSIMITKNCL